ncbi:hypothetical protein IE4872_PC00343 (plasmid) [Rhizobium gallicum]|uniref:Uncharacterized protein n=1 Tax=Rhizobium gallicum TaxID=56730 RepID=A0A1L5NR67_9HYPH|nr:hypothetical protein IE4872_PC00343 [Rhizobium gallicum]
MQPRRRSRLNFTMGDGFKDDVGIPTRLPGKVPPAYPIFHPDRSDLALGKAFW